MTYGTLLKAGVSVHTYVDLLLTERPHTVEP